MSSICLLPTVTRVIAESGRLALASSDEVGDQRNVIRLFKSALKRAGLPATVRFHDLRHGSATVALAAGVGMKTTSTRLGHSTITITADLYTHAVRALDQDAATRIERALAGAV